MQQQQRKSASSPAALQSPVVTTLLYDYRATFTTPSPLTATSRSYDDPNADIGFDDESAAFSEEDMPSKMPLDDDSDYAASLVPSSRLMAVNSSHEDRPHTVAPIRNLPLSPANRARSSGRDDGRSGRNASPYETTVAPRAHWSSSNSIVSSGSERKKNVDYGIRLRNRMNGRQAGDLGGQSSNVSNDKKRRDSDDDETGDVSVEYADGDDGENRDMASDDESCNELDSNTPYVSTA